MVIQATLFWHFSWIITRIPLNSVPILAMSSPIFFALRPRGPNLGARVAAGPCSPPQTLILTGNDPTESYFTQVNFRWHNNKLSQQGIMSTILNCDESALICTLRLLEGSLAAIAALTFVKAYLLISKDKALNFSAEDKLLFLLEGGQLLVLGTYYLLFEQFFLLATMRSLMIWSSICLFQYISSSYYQDPDTKNYLSWGCMLLRLLNFLLWFYVAIVDGTTIQNKNFNVGYNCLVMDWTILSCFFLGTSSMLFYVTMMHREKLQFLRSQSNQEGKEFYENQINTLLLLAVVNLASPLILFVWDFLAFVNSSSETHCVQFFSGNSVLTSLICFFLKVVCLQGPAYVVYQCVYKRREGKMVLSIMPENNLELLLDKRSEVASNSSGQRYSHNE